MLDGRSWTRDRRVWVGGAALLAVVALVVTVLVWPAGEDERRSRQFREASACLLTDADGVAGGEAAAVWAGMQEASLATSARVRFLEVEGPGTADNARGFLGSLVLGGCDLVLAVGDAQVQAVVADVATYPDVPFVVVDVEDPGAGVTWVEAGAPEVVSAVVSHIVAERLDEPALD